MTQLIQAVQQALAALESGELLCEITAASMLRVALAAEQAQALQPATGERAELIAGLHEHATFTCIEGAEKQRTLKAADMLEADAGALRNLRQIVDLQSEIILEREVDIGKLETDANKWREFQAALDRKEDRS